MIQLPIYCISYIRNETEVFLTQVKQIFQGMSFVKYQNFHFSVNLYSIR